MPAFDRKASSTSWRIVAGSRATSSWRKQKNPAPSTSSSASFAAGPNPGLVVEPPDVGRGEVGGNPRGHVLVARGVDDEHGEVRVVLGGERGEQLVEPCAGILGHQHGDDRRRRLRLGLHNGPRLAAEVAGNGHWARLGALRGSPTACAIDHKCLQLFNSAGSVASTPTRNARRSDAHHFHPPTSKPFETATKPAKDVFYVTVGLGVMGYEQPKSNQGNLRGWFESQVADGKAQFEESGLDFAQRRPPDRRALPLETKFEACSRTCRRTCPSRSPSS